MQLPRIVTDDPYQIIDDEWRTLSTYKLPHYINISDDMNAFWHQLFEYDTED